MALVDLSPPDQVPPEAHQVLDERPDLRAREARRFSRAEVQEMIGRAAVGVFNIALTQSATAGLAAE
jgi:hypothetical protein